MILLARAGSEQRRLVEYVGEIGTGTADGALARRASRSTSCVERLALGVDAEDVQAALDVGGLDADLAVEAARAQQGRVEDVQAVGGGDEDDVLVLASNPSISTSIWLRVCSRSSWPPPMPAPRWRPTASISSMKMIAGAFCFACLNRSRTRLAPTPTNISTKSEPEIE